MVSAPEQPTPPPARRRWGMRILMASLYLALAAAALWLGMSVPAYVRAISPLVLEAAARGTPTLLEQAADQVQAGRPGGAALLLAAARTAGIDAPEALARQLDDLLAAHPGYRWSGGPAPFFEQFLRQAPFLREDEPAVIPTLLPAENRRRLHAFLSQSPNRNVHTLLEARSLGGWERFYPVYSTSGHPLEATLLTAALLEQSSAIPAGIHRPLLASVAGALDGDLRAQKELETLLIGLLAIGRQVNWLQLQSLLERLEDPGQLLFAAHVAQENPARLPALFAALWNTRDPGMLAAYLNRHGDRGWEGLTTALGLGAGALERLLQSDKPVYRPPRLWNALPLAVRESQRALNGFAEAVPGMALGLRAAAFGLCGMFLVAILRVLVLGRRRLRDPARRVLINLDSVVGAVLVMLLVWVLIEPGLLDFRPNEQGSLQIKLAQILPEDTLHPEEPALSAMIDHVTLLVLLLFFVAQLLVFIFGLLKIAEVRRHPAPPEVKIHLLENEEVLFDLGLYVGLGGTVTALIMVVLNLVDASLMAAYASTLFGIIFVATLKIGFLRPFRRQLILAKQGPSPQ